MHRNLKQQKKFNSRDSFFRKFPFCTLSCINPYENSNKKNIHNMPQGLPNPGFMQEKVQKGDFLKKPLRELIFFVVVVLGFYESLEGVEC